MFDLNDLWPYHVTFDTSITWWSPKYIIDLSLVAIEGTCAKLCVMRIFYINFNFEINDLWPPHVTSDTTIIWRSPRCIYDLNLIGKGAMVVKLCLMKVLQVNFKISHKMTFDLKCDFRSHDNMNAPQMHLPPNFGCRCSNMCQVMCHEILHVNFNIWPKMTFDLTMWPPKLPIH